ncbi:MAG: NADH-quinone oxidoreductase subunit NuoG [Gammaproteobacteria bacterium]
MSDIEIEIDGKKLQAKPNAMVIQVADEAGIYIPRFCYHKLLSVAANCRMCLVEVEKSPKALPACATPVMPGMKVFTRSAKAIAAQKAVMEFLLINHPLDCPICDQGGECELQDLSMGYGSSESNFCEGKRAVKDQDLGPLIATEMTRCIQCTRCVRFGSEIAGFRELGATGRGENMEIGTYIQHALQSEVSGNIIDICPVGALTSKPYRFTARAWELIQNPSIAPHDCLGSNIYVHTRQGNVMRVVPHENMAINQTWLSDRDRFSYEGLNHVDRLEKPLIRVDDEWQEVDWQTALEFTLQGLQTVLNTHGAAQLGALASPNATVEEFYLLQKMLRSIGSSNIDHRLRQVDFSDQNMLPAFPGLNMPIADLETCDAVLLIGANLQKEQPMASLRLRKAFQNGARIMTVNMLDYDLHYKLAAKKIVAPQDFTKTLTGIVKALETGANAQEADTTIAKLLREGRKVCVLLGAQSLNHPEAATIRDLAYQIAEQTNATLGFLSEGANAAGAWLAGAVPHRGPSASPVSQGLDAQAMWNKALKGYLLLNVEPDLDCANPVAAMNALDQAEFVVSLSMFKNPVLEQYANVLLPIAAFTETSGTFVNTEGTWQTFKGVAAACGEARPAWKVLRVLANFLHCEGFDFESSEQVRKEVYEMVSEHSLSSHYSRDNDRRSADSAREKEAGGNTLHRIGEIPLYSNDSLVRRAKSLQATQAIIEGNLAAVRMHPGTAARLHLKETEPVIIKQHEGRVRLPVMFDKRVPENAMYIAGSIPATSGLSQLFGPIEIQKA